MQIKFTVFTLQHHMQDETFLKDLLDTQRENICIGHLKTFNVIIIVRAHFNPKSPQYPNSPQYPKSHKNPQQSSSIPSPG